MNFSFRLWLEATKNGDFPEVPKGLAQWILNRLSPVERSLLGTARGGRSARSYVDEDLWVRPFLKPESRFMRKQEKTQKFQRTTPYEYMKSILTGS